MEFTVGQIIYLLDESKNSVLPAMVSEHVVKHTLNGQEETYYVQAGKAKKHLDLSQFSGKYFTSSEDVKSFLYENLKKNIDKIVEKTESVALVTWPEAASQKVVEEKNDSGGITVEGPEDSGMIVELGDGRVARYRG